MDQGEIALTEGEFRRIRDRLYSVAGISLSDAKKTLVFSRLGKIVRRMGYDSFDEYVDFLERSGSSADDQEFVNALTTNLTRFFREDHHFDHLKDYVGKLIQSTPRTSPGGKPRLRLWSAGCSTGQEPYTIILHLLSSFPELKRWDFKLLATDIDTNVLAKAAQGVYPESELSGLSPERMKLFERPGDGTIRIPAEARQIASFKPLNLMHDFPVKGPFDAIFCRNVAIYFDKPTQLQLFNRLGGVLAPNGFLYIGHSENMGPGAKGFSLVGKTIYEYKNQSSRSAA